MFGRIFCAAALVLATAALDAQTTTTGKNAAPASGSPAARGADQYVPAILQDRLTTVTGCLQKTDGWVLTGATTAGQTDAATYKLQGISDARLSLFEGKRIDATGAQPIPKGASAVPAATQPATNPRIFEATAVKAATPDACS